MRKLLLLSVALGMVGMTTAARAVTVSLTEGPLDPLYFESKGADQNNFTLGGITWSLVSGSAATEKGSLAGVYAAPLGMGASTITGTTYMAVEGGGVESATWATPQTSLAIYWGSIDGDVCGAGSASCGNNNKLTITAGSYTLTGADLIGKDGVLGEGQQGNPADNQLVVITGLTPFTTATFSSTGNAFEFSLVSVPEPSTWAMLLVGFSGLGYAAFRRRTKDRLAIGTL